MTYVRLLRLIDALLRHCETTTGWWTFTDWRGRLAFRQIDYAKRVQKASGWDPVQWSATPLVNYTTANSATNGVTVTYALTDRRDTQQ